MFSVNQLMQTMEKTRRAWGAGVWGRASAQAGAITGNESETDIKLILN